MLNPFVVGDYLSQEYFCGRSNEAKVLEECIREGKNVVLHSARRLGKNHLIEHVFHKAKKNSGVFALMPVYAEASKNLLFSWLTVFSDRLGTIMKVSKSLPASVADSG